jgi:antitoxin PrlF
MHIVTVSSKGQIVLPACVRKRLGLSAGAQLELVESESALQLTVIREVPSKRVSELAGMLVARSQGKPRSLASFDPASSLNRKR